MTTRSNVHPLPMKLPSTTPIDDRLDRALAIITSYEQLVMNQREQLAALRVQRDQAQHFDRLCAEMRDAISELKRAAHGFGLWLATAPALPPGTHRAAFADRACSDCGATYTPSGPRQRRCAVCRGIAAPVGERLADVVESV